MKYNSKWDLSSIPPKLLRAEYAKSIKPPAPRARVELPCIQCATPLSARERRKPCPKCGTRHPRKWDSGAVSQLAGEQSSNAQMDAGLNPGRLNE